LLESRTKVLRMSVARFQIATALVPVALILATVARRSGGGVFVYVLAFAAQAAAFAAFFGARRSFVVTGLRREGSRLGFVETDESVARTEVTLWTWSDGRARVYTSRFGWTLTAAPGASPDALRAFLAGIFGEPRALRRRGSTRGRLVALAVALLGSVVWVYGFFVELPLIAVACVPCVVFGLATFGALSQQIVVD